MALTVGTGPFGTKSNGEFNFDTSILRPHTLYFENSPRRMRVEFGGEKVADSIRAKLLHETGHLPVYYFPEEDVQSEFLEKTDHTTHCPFKGDASYWSVKVDDKVAENAVWGYEQPMEGAPPLAGFVAFYFGAMDKWFEEDEEISVHPRDPYHRVDIRKSSRHVKVSVNGTPVAETNRPMVLFETGLPPRYYIPREDVRTDLLTPSETVTHCPYKGEASYWSAEVDGKTVEDVAWSYKDPLPEAEKAAGYLCFLGDEVELEVDGEKV